MLYLSNVFSLNMVRIDDSMNVKIKPIFKHEIKLMIENVYNDPSSTMFKNAIGHTATDSVVRFDLKNHGIDLDAGKRSLISLTKYDTLIVAQYHGERLSDGATEPPIGSKINYYTVRIAK